MHTLPISHIAQELKAQLEGYTGLVIVAPLGKVKLQPHENIHILHNAVSPEAQDAAILIKKTSFAE